MITQPVEVRQASDWQTELKTLITCAKTLLEYLEIDKNALPWQMDDQFPLRVPKSFVARMEKGNPHDPLLLQVLPLQAENHEAPGFIADPLQETKQALQPGLIQKYQVRVLIPFAPSCAINCRYCFRRHFPYHTHHAAKKHWPDMIRQITADTSLIEVILSGGDPLMAPNTWLQTFTEAISQIPHIEILRIHTRLPVVIESRVDNALCTILQHLPLQKVMVLHINHANEISPALVKKVEALKASGVTVLNQSVLLKGINDGLSQLQSLSKNLFRAGILPYYCHLLDPVKGAQHFQVDKEKARQLATQLRATLPGYLVPRFVEEVPFATAKMPI